MQKYVTYEQFGAKGDGVSEDFAAIYAAHEYANAEGLPVKASEGATYYIHNTYIDGEVRTIRIRTDVEWTGANFIIDDSDLDFTVPELYKMSQYNIFTVCSDYDVLTLNGDNAKDLLESIAPLGVSHGTSKIDLGLGYPALLVLSDETNRVYRRYGPDGVNGQSSPTMEIIVVDKDGYVSDETPFMFDYTVLNKIDVYRTDDKPVTVKGGNVKTIACDVPILKTDENGNVRRAGYFARGLNVRRSHTVIDGIKHSVVGEISVERQRAGDRGAHYSGFFTNVTADGILIKNCTLQGRRYYGVCGTYEFNARLVNNIILDNCVQNNFWVDEDGNPSETDTGRLSMERIDINGGHPPYCWGTGGTNFCKNMKYIRSTLSRFDAHQGLYNGACIDSTVQAFELIGKGTFTVKNVKWYSYTANASSVLALRSDYGSTWDGELVIDGLDLYASSPEVTLVPFGFANWYFGYTCHIPNVIIKGLRVFDKKTREPMPEGYPVNIYSKGIAVEPYMHKPETKQTHPRSIQYSEELGKKAFLPVPERGFVNDNPIAPPEYVKLIDNEGKYLYALPKSNDPEFFLANTRFYYTENDYYIGTNHENAENFTFVDMTPKN